MKSKGFSKIILLISLFLISIYNCEYFIGSNMGNYNTAIQTCLDDGGIIGTITNENEYNIARELCINNGTDCWIGLNDKYYEGIWNYIDGTSIKGTYGFNINGHPTVGVGPWGDTEPNNDRIGEVCVEFRSNTNWTWNDKICTHIRTPICMRIETKPLKQLMRIYIAIHEIYHNS